MVGHGISELLGIAGEIPLNPLQYTTTAPDATTTVAGRSPHRTPCPREVGSYEVAGQMPGRKEGQTTYSARGV